MALRQGWPTMLLQHNLRRLLRHPEVQSVAPELGEPEDHPLAFRAASLLTDWTEPQRAVPSHRFHCRAPVDDGGVLLAPTQSRPGSYRIVSRYCALQRPMWVVSHRSASRPTGGFPASMFTANQPLRRDKQTTVEAFACKQRNRLGWRLATQRER